MFNLKKLMDIRNKLSKNRTPDIAILILFFFFCLVLILVFCKLIMVNYCYFNYKFIYFI